MDGKDVLIGKLMNNGANACPSNWGLTDFTFNGICPKKYLAEGMDLQTFCVDHPEMANVCKSCWVSSIAKSY